MKNKRLYLLSFLFVFLLAIFTSCGGRNTFTLTILHTNDWHGVLKDVPKYATLIKAVRAETPNVLLLDGGDIYRRGPYEEFMGALETDIMNAMSYDALTFGNNDYPPDDDELADLSHHPILQNANFPVLAANVTIDGVVLDGFAPYTIINVAGKRVAVIGVTSLKPRLRGYDVARRATFVDPIRTVNIITAETKPLSDIQIVLSHAGDEADVQLRGVSAVIGADFHTVRRQPFIIKDGKHEIPLVEAGGENDHYLGRLDLTFKKVKGEWVLQSFEGRLLSVAEVLPDAEIQAIIDSYAALMRDAA